MPGKISNLAPHCSVRIVNPSSKEKRAFDATAACLCRGVQQHGSLLKAAKMIPISYSKAWQLKKEVEEALDMKIIASETGPNGSHLTQQGIRLLRAYDELVESCQSLAEDLLSDALRDG